MSGSLDVLSVGEGHITLSWNHYDEPEAIRAERMITDMLRRGYALLVQTEDGKLQRVTSFDRNHKEYVVADFDPMVGFQRTVAASGQESVRPADTPPAKEELRIVALDDGREGCKLPDFGYYAVRNRPTSKWVKVDGRSREAREIAGKLGNRLKGRVPMHRGRATAVAPTAGGTTERRWK